jgi:nitrate reductase NapAB chaperone NapD
MAFLIKTVEITTDTNGNFIVPVENRKEFLFIDNSNLQELKIVDKIISINLNWHPEFVKSISKRYISTNKFKSEAKEKQTN